MTTKHGWVEHDGSFHCYWCGDNFHGRGEPPADGCLDLTARAEAFIVNPLHIPRRQVAQLVRDLVDENARLAMLAHDSTTRGPIRTDELAACRRGLIAILRSVGIPVRVSRRTLYDVGPDDVIVEHCDPAQDMLIYSAERKPPLGETPT